MRGIKLIVVLATLRAGLMMSPALCDMPTRRIEPVDPVDRVYMDAVAAGRQLMFGKPLPKFHGQRHAVSALTVEMELTNLNRSKPTARNIRMLASIQFLSGSATWQRTLLRMRTVPYLSQSGVERELACWRAALVGPASPSMVNEYVRQIQSMQIGWFRHVLLASLYSHSGRAGDFENEISRANHSTGQLLLVWDFWTAARIIGLIANLGLMTAWLASRKVRTGMASLWARPAPPLGISTLSSSAAIYLIGTLVTAACWPLTNMSEGIDSEGAALRVLVQVLLPTLPVIGWLAIQWKRTGFSLSQVGFSPVKLVQGAGIGLASYLLLLPWLYGASWISDAMASGATETPLHPAVAILAGTHTLVLRRVLIVIALVIAPLMEEIIFRGCIQNVMVKRWGPWIGVALSAGAFAAVHPQLPAGLPVLLVLGAGFGIAYRMSRNLWVPITMHAVNNAAVLCVVSALFME